MFGPSFDLYLRFFLRRNYRKAKKQTSLDYASVLLLPSLTTAVIRVAAKNSSEHFALAEITRFFLSWICFGSGLNRQRLLNNKFDTLVSGTELATGVLLIETH
jgi:hypothetical protein